MFSSQYILIIGSLSILTLLIITFANVDGTIGTLSIDNEAIIAGTGMGQTIIEKISSKPFDEKVIKNSHDSADSLTAPIELGPDEGESSFEQFDDMDDFNNYSYTDSLRRLGEFEVDVSVHYVLRNDQHIKSDVRTLYKLVTVNISNSYLKDKLKLNFIASY